MHNPPDTISFHPCSNTAMAGRFGRARPSGAGAGNGRRGGAGGRPWWSWAGSAKLLAAALLSVAAFTRPAQATQFLDDFEGDGEVSQVPATSLHNWNIITSVDLQTESYPQPLCHDTGSCIDLVGTVGATTGGLISKRSYPLNNYMIGFFLYGSGRDRAGSAVSSGGTVSRLQVSFGGSSIYVNKAIGSDFAKFVVVRVRGAGRLQFLAGGEVADIGPLLDNALIIPITPAP